MEHNQEQPIETPVKKQSDYKFFAICDSNQAADSIEDLVVSGITKAELKRNLAQRADISSIKMIIRGRQVKFESQRSIKL